MFRVPLFVAPYVGAWIETRYTLDNEKNLESHPMWVRGLKPHCQIRYQETHTVAPYVGAWIETH